MRRYVWIIFAIILLVAIAIAAWIIFRPTENQQKEDEPIVSDSGTELISPHLAFESLSGTYEGTWIDKGQGRNGSIEVIFAADEDVPTMSMDVRDIPALPFTGPQSGTGVYNEDGTVTFESTNPVLYGDAKITLKPDGTIAASGSSGLPFGVAFEGTGTIDNLGGLVFKYKVTQGNLTFDAEINLPPKDEN